MNRKASSRSSGRRAQPAWPTNPKAEAAVRFFRALRHVKGRWAGQPFTLLPWQEKIVRDLFGTLRPDGLRQYRTAYIEVPRKAGKSTLAAGMALLLLFEGEPGAEVVSAAADRDQAAIVFETARQMVEATPELVRHVKLYRRAIYVPRLQAVYKVLSADVPTKHGLNCHGIVFDELHAQRTRDLWDTLVTSTGARTQPMTVAITTAGYDRQSICWELHEYARQVRDGIIDDPTFYPAIFAAGENDPWDDPATWHTANPSLGHTVPEEFYRDEARKAAASPGYQNTFRRLYLNQWTQQSVRWIDLRLWDENDVHPVREEDLVGRPCFGGLDLSTVSDLTAWVLVFPHDDDPEAVDILARFWCPEARLHDPYNRYREQYQAWAQAGYLTPTPGNAIDYEAIKAQALADAERFNLVSANIDRKFQGYQLHMELTAAGLEIAAMHQGYAAMSGPMRELERRLLVRKVHHGGNPVLRWMADNISVKQDAAGNIKPDRVSSQGKVDGIVALVMALDRAMRHGVAEEQRSVYEERGLLVL